MSKKRFARISVSIWNDAKFQELSTAAKLIFFFLLTTQHLTLLGLVPLQKAAIGSMCGLSKQQSARALDELIHQKMIEYDVAGLFWLRNFFKHTPPDNSNVVLAWAVASDLCPECGLKDRVLAEAGEHCLRRGDEFLRAFMKIFPDKCPGMGLGKGNSDGSPVKKKTQETEIEKKEAKTTSAGRVPFPYRVLPDQWRIKCFDLRPDIDPNGLFEKVLTHYTSSDDKRELRTLDEWAKTWIGWVKKELV